MAGYELIASRRAGSAIVEMAFALAAIPFTLTEIPYLETGAARDRLLSFNPLGQVPTLVLPDGGVMTESAAMVLHLADAAPTAGLLPNPGDPARPTALNTLLLFVAAIYPTVTFSDAPQDWTQEGAAADMLRDRLGERKAALWKRLEASAAPAPFLGGARPSALDLYVAVMTQWRPGPDWFAAETPKLAGIARAVAEWPGLAEIMRRNFEQAATP